MKRKVKTAIETCNCFKNRLSQKNRTGKGSLMKKITLFSTLLLFPASGLLADSSVTRYYKQVKVVTKDRKEQAGDGSGQFITFNDKGCYDSDKSGYTVKNGFLKLGKATSERVYYSGGSYWGEAMYIFTENYNRMNIIVEKSGVTYVYARATPPAGVTTCALIRTTETLPTPNPVIVNPVNPINPINPIDRRTPTAKQKYVTREESCPQCYNSGKCSTCHGSGVVISTYTQKYDNCVNCYNGKCRSCNGTGKVTRGKWETVYE
jgi:hypothetical protein